jgi:hypothetical protein
MVVTSCAGWRTRLQELNVTSGIRGHGSVCQDDWTGTKRTAASLVTISFTSTRPPDRSPICCITGVLHAEMRDVIKQILLNYIEEGMRSHEDGEVLLERIAHRPLSAEDRRVAVQLLRATQACQELSAQPRPTAQPASKHTAKRTRQMAKASRRRHRCSGWGEAYLPITDVMGAPWSPKLRNSSFLCGHGQRCRLP